MSRPTTDKRLYDLNLLFSLYAYRAVAWGGAGGTWPPPPVFCPKSQNMHEEKLKLISQSIETMMSLKLGETFYGFKRPAQWVLRTQNSLRFFALNR